MSLLRTYCISIICAATVCAIISSITKDSSQKKVIRMVCCFFLSVELIKPLLLLSKVSIQELEPIELLEAKQIVQEGSAHSKNELERVISEEIKAYILSKTKVQDSDFTIQITLKSNSQPIPEMVTVIGSFTEDEKEHLQWILEQDFAIAKENQVWTGG